MKLKEFLNGKKQTEFKVRKVTFEVTESTGEKIALLHLEKPLDTVQGSQTITDDATNETSRVEAYDVDVVRVGPAELEDEGIELNEDGTGEVKSDLRLDVSQKGDVWLKKQSFASFGAEKRRENQNNRRSGIIAKMNERKTTATFKGAGANPENKQAPEPVAKVS